MRNVFFIILLSGFFASSCKQQETTVTKSSTPTFSNGCNLGKWSTNAPINLKISSEFSNELSNINLVNGLNPIELVAKNWNSAIPNRNFFTVPFQTTSTTGYSNLNDFRDGEFGIYKSHTWFSNASSSALAITQFYGYVRSDGSLGTYIDLTHADIIVNYRDYGSDFTYNTNILTGFDLPTVLIHEMGHFLGMCHDSTHTSIMRPYYVSTQRTLFSFDIQKITDLYVKNKNTLGNSTNSNAITLPEGSEVKGVIELLKDGKCRHYINGKLVLEHESENKKGLALRKAFSKILSKQKKL